MTTGCRQVGGCIAERIPQRRRIEKPEQLDGQDRLVAHRERCASSADTGNDVKKSRDVGWSPRNDASYRTLHQVGNAFHQRDAIFSRARKTRDHTRSHRRDVTRGGYRTIVKRMSFDCRPGAKEGRQVGLWCRLQTPQTQDSSRQLRASACGGSY